MDLQEEMAWRERIHRMYAAANELFRQAGEENKRFREYLESKYDPQPTSFH